MRRSLSRWLQLFTRRRIKCIEPRTRWPQTPEQGRRSCLRCEDLNLQLEDGTGIVTIRRTVFEGQEFTTKSNKVRHVPIDASVVEELEKHLNGRRFGYVFQTRNGTALRESNILPDLHGVLDELGIPRGLSRRPA